MDLAVDTVPPTKLDEVGDLFARAIKLQQTRDPLGTAVHQIRLSLARLRQRKSS